VNKPRVYNIHFDVDSCSENTTTHVCSWLPPASSFFIHMRCAVCGAQLCVELVVGVIVVVLFF
jgi:hypothetical protein